jgi:hypothetical protein
MRNAPQDPGPVSTGERIAVRLSWSLPLDQRARHAVQNLGVSSVIEIEQTRKTMVRRGRSRVRDRGDVCCMRIKNSWTGLFNIRGACAGPRGPFASIRRIPLRSECRCTRDRDHTPQQAERLRYWLA